MIINKEERVWLYKFVRLEVLASEIPKDILGSLITKGFLSRYVDRNGGESIVLA